MSKRRKRIILLACGIFTLGLICALLPAREPEPSYQGRRLSEWVDQLRESSWLAGGTSESREAEKAIRAIGTNAIPTILKWISYQTSMVRYQLFAGFHSSRFGRLIFRSEERSGGAVDVFALLGPEARAAIPELTRLARTSSDPMRALRCISALASIGTEAFPAMLTLATNSPPHARKCAIAKLPAFGTNALAAVPVLLPMINDPDPLVSNAASKALQQIRR